MRKLAPLLCAAALTLSLTVPAGAYYASNENGANEPGGPITSVSVTTEPVAEPTLPSLGGLTPDGNLALIDDILGIVALTLVTSVADPDTSTQGKYVPRKETIRGFEEILDGKHDDLPESAFLFVGTIDEAVEKARKGENG